MFVHLRQAPAVLALAALMAGSAAAAVRTVPVDPQLPAFRPATAVVAPPADARYVLPNRSIRIGGADHAQFILERVDALFAKSHPGYAFALDLKGTSTGIPLLTYAATPFTIIGRRVTPIELVPYEKIVGTKPLEIEIAHTAFASTHLATSLAVYVNAANPIDKLTVDDAARIFTQGNAGGDLSAWGQLGERGDWKAAPIHPISGFASGGFGNYESQVFHGRPFAADVEYYPDTAAILKRVGQDRFAVGIAATGRTDPGIKSVALANRGGTYSSGDDADVVAGTYPFGRYVYLYVRREPGKPVDAFVKEYVRLILSRDGQQIVASQPDGYLPLSAAEAAHELAKLEDVK